MSLAIFLTVSLQIDIKALYIKPIIFKRRRTHYSSKATHYLKLVNCAQQFRDSKQRCFSIEKRTTTVEKRFVF